MEYAGVHPRRFYVENFANGISTFFIYFDDTVTDAQVGLPASTHTPAQGAATDCSAPFPIRQSRMVRPFVCLFVCLFVRCDVQLEALSAVIKFAPLLADSPGRSALLWQLLLKNKISPHEFVYVIRLNFALLLRMSLHNMQRYLLHVACRRLRVAF
jgi:hypothetical protein